ncbi:hypothetical protein [Halorarum salinum]|uniref:Uncharacterized protein n=1 Tax=Halorarum salinum TaxID=2743089 RepID=A0A7D5QD18_9EURY|nr:hypothetical protein [Halobaculum salinum]QLG63499.1 hypothetical protein HUG12_17905 [Halobaculum salinum]
MNEERAGDAASTDGSAERTAAGETLADVSHVHPDTAETFWAVYRRGPAVADGGARRARRNASGPVAPDDDGRAGTAGTTGDDGSTLADVAHEPPYPEPKGIWTRGPARAGDAETGDEDPDV